MTARSRKVDTFDTCLGCHCKVRFREARVKGLIFWLPWNPDGSSHLCERYEQTWRDAEAHGVGIQPEEKR